MRKGRTALFLLLPTLIVMSLFTVYPLLNGVRMAFTNEHLLKDTSEFVGLDNFVELFTDDRVFHISFRHSLILTSLVVLSQLVLGLVLAWAMDQDLPGMAFFKSIIMASWVIPVAATVTMFKFMAQADVGFMNIALRSIGLQELTRYWFGDPNTALPFIILLHLWRNVPFYGVAFLAAMQAIPRSYYEAAEIDGANAWQQFVHVTLPGIRSMIIVMVTIHVLWTFNNFDFVYLATAGGPVNATDILPVYVYRRCWRNYTVGYGASVGVIMLAVLMVYFVVYIRLYGRRS